MINCLPCLGSDSIIIFEEEIQRRPFKMSPIKAGMVSFWAIKFFSVRLIGCFRKQRKLVIKTSQHFTPVKN